MKSFLNIFLSLFLIISFLFLNSDLLAQTTSTAKTKITDTGNGIYSIQYANIDLTVNSNLGARIISLKVGGNELLISSSKNPLGLGSTFWPAPQSNWNWPPPFVLDSKPYQPLISDNTLKLVSGDDKKTGLQFTKVISVSEKDTSVEINYTMKNISESPLKAAPWEISRMPKGGIILFPKGKAPFSKKYFELIPYVEKDNVVWYKSDKDEVQKADLLTVTDGSEGWLAYINNNNILVKKFEDISPDKLTPGEGEVCLFSSAAGPYIEVEAEGKYEEIQPGKSTTWTMKWYPRVVKDGTTGIGDKKLVKFVRDLIK